MRFSFVLPIDEYFTPGWSGAIATVTRQLVTILGSLGHECLVLAPDDGENVYDDLPVTRLEFGPAHRRSVVARKLASGAARARGLPRWDYAAYWSAVRRVLDRAPRADVIIANDPVTATRLAQRDRATRVVLWLHNFPDRQVTEALRNLPDAVLVVAVSEAVARATAKGSDGRVSPLVVPNGVDTHVFHPPKEPPAGRPLRVVCHGRIDPNKGQDAAALGVAMLRQEGRDIELTVIGELRTFGFDQAVADAYASRVADAVLVLAVSEAVARATVTGSDGRVSPLVIHNGVDTRLFHPPSEPPAGRPLRVVCHGRIDPNKGQDAAALGVAMLRQEGHDVELTVIGELRTFGFDQAVADAYASRVADAVALAGGRMLGWMPHDQLAVELRTYDIACALSRVEEPFGLAALEAMASGCAVVATSKGGLPEVVGSAGVMVAPDSPEEVAAAIRSLSDLERLRDVRRACSERAAGLTWSATANRFLQVLDEPRRARAATGATDRPRTDPLRGDGTGTIG